MNTQKQFATTVNYYPDHADFAERAHVLDVPPSLERADKSELWDEFRLLVRILRAALHYDVLLFFSHRGRLLPELLATIILGLLPQRWRPAVVFHGEMYEPNSGLRCWLERLVMRLADRAIVRYVVYSKAEMSTFAKTWRVDPAKLRFAHHPFYGARKREDSTFVPPASAPHIFAGGNSFRDYAALVAAARTLPTVQFVICTSELAAAADLPTNVRASAVSHQEFSQLMKSAGAVVIPLQRNTQRITGALTYLQSMWLRKPTIVSDALGAREYIEDGVTGWVVEGSPASYAQAIRWVLDPAHTAAVEQVCENAHAAVDQRFSMDSHVRKLLAIMEEVVAMRLPKVDRVMLHSSE